MVFESIKLDWMEHRPFIVLFFGFAYSLLGYFLATIFFGNTVSIAMLFLTTLFAVPSLIRILDVEERIESKEGLRHFFHNHKEIFEVYLFLFLGIFLGYIALALGSANMPTLFDFQMKFLARQESLSGELIQSFFTRPLQPSPTHVMAILSNNLLVSAICFLLSVFYGAGAIFLLVLNASIFSSFIVFVSQQLARVSGDAIVIFGFFSIHLVPEVAGFLTAAIAGGVVSKAILTEKVFSEGFKNVVRDAIALLLLSMVFIMLGAVLEVYVTAPLFYHYF
ncbi:stage II sporulation protein M [Candidatus Woesearchaeota archaeon]|nr:stage II sporulation protein M [Candidatus Woesearchaeota archaeon]